MGLEKEWERIEKGVHENRPRVPLLFTRQYNAVQGSP